MTQTSHHMVVRVLKKDGYWVGLPVNTPGSMMGDTLTELFDEVENLKRHCLGVSDDATVNVEYSYELPELEGSILGEYRDLRSQRDQLSSRLEDTAQSVASRLRGAGVSLSDSAALLGLPLSRVDQLMRGI